MAKPRPQRDPGQGVAETADGPRSTRPAVETPRFVDEPRVTGDVEHDQFGVGGTSVPRVSGVLGDDKAGSPGSGLKAALPLLTA